MPVPVLPAVMDDEEDDDNKEEEEEEGEEEEEEEGECKVVVDGDRIEQDRTDRVDGFGGPSSGGCSTSREASPPMNTIDSGSAEAAAMFAIIVS